jgi:toxin ParE1/3/4
MSRVIWTVAAEKRRDEALAYTANDNVHAALRQLEEIQRQVRRLREQPNMGRPGKVRGARELVIRHTPFIVVYRVFTDTVQIVRFLHSAQNR